MSIRFIDVDPKTGTGMLPLLDAWNEKAWQVEGLLEDWDLAFKPTFAPDCYGTFLKEGANEIVRGTVTGFMKGDIVIMPKDSNKGMPNETSYDFKLAQTCFYTVTIPGGQPITREFDCYIHGSGVREPYNGQLCNHACAGQNCQYIPLEPVEVTKVLDDGTRHTLCLPYIGVQTIQNIQEGQELLVDYGEYMLSDKTRAGFIPCKCSACARAGDGNGRFIRA